MGGANPAPQNQDYRSTINAVETVNQKSTSETIVTFDTNHEGIIHDTQFDYYGTRISTCDSQGVVKISKMEGNAVNDQ